MTCLSRLSAASIATAVILGAGTASAQLQTGEQRAFARVDSAATAVESAADREAMLRATEQILDAAEDALSAFTAAARRRAVAADRYEAAVSEAIATVVRCDTGYQCTAPGRIDYVDGLAAARARNIEASSLLAAMLAAYVEAVGISGAEEDSERAMRLQRFADRMRGLEGNNEAKQQGRDALLRQVQVEVDAGNTLYSWAAAAHVAANRVARDGLSRAARTLSAAARRLTDQDYQGTRAVEVLRRAESVDAAALAALAVSSPSPRSDGSVWIADIRDMTDRTAATLEELILAARETLVVLQSHVGLVAQRVREHEVGPNFEEVDRAGSVEAEAEAEPVNAAGAEAAVSLVLPLDVQASTDIVPDAVAEPADLAEWVREVNAGVTAAEEAAAEAEAAAAGSGSWFSRAAACVNAQDRLTGALARVEALTVGESRPSYVTSTAGEEAYAELGEQLESARERGRVACASIELPR